MLWRWGRNHRKTPYPTAWDTEAITPLARMLNATNLARGLFALDFELRPVPRIFGVAPVPFRAYRVAVFLPSSPT